MNFEDAIEPLRKFLITNGYSVKIETNYLIEFSSSSTTRIRIAYSPFEHSFIIWMGRNENSLIEILSEVVTEFFNDNTFKFQPTLTIKDLITFLSSSGKHLLTGDTRTFEELEKYSFQKSNIYNSSMNIKYADEAWTQKDYANFVKYINKVQADLLHPSYLKKYQIAIRKINS